MYLIQREKVMINIIHLMNAIVAIHGLTIKFLDVLMQKAEGCHSLIATRYSFC